MPRKSNTEEFIKKARKKQGNRYDYRFVDYVNAKTRVKIICPEHGVFEQIPNNHLNGNGCPDCSGNRKSNTEEFIEKSNIKHDFRYDYSLVNYINNSIDVKIICPIHGSFPQKPNNHLGGQGCPECAGKNKTTVELIGEFNIIHDFKYDYSLVNYINTITEVEIICPVHGSFTQTPDKHLAGRGCQKCSHIISKPETQWLDSLNIPDDKEHRRVSIKINNKRFKVDGFDPIANTIYEFYGDFWHGNPTKFKIEEINGANHKAFGELYAKTLEKESILKSAGYNIISIWESDFKKK